MIEQLIISYSNNPTLLIISAITFSVGYIQYVYSFRLVMSEGKAPFPVWMHTLYFAHDATAAVIFFILAQGNDWFWFFSLASLALFIWTLFELFNLYMAIKVERQEIWGSYYSKPMSQSQALMHVLLQTTFMFVLVNLLRIFMQDDTMFKWFLLTNVVMAVGPGLLWRQRISREGSSIGLAIVIVFGTVLSFLPPGLGMFTTALPSTFDQPWFYATGLVTALIALCHLTYLWKLPPKTQKSMQKAIW